MGRKSRRKGKVGELELAKVLRGLGVEARRGRQFKGTADSPDVVTSLRGVHLECKRVEALRLYPSLQQAIDEAPEGAIPIVCHRKSRKPWVTILKLEDLVQLLREAGRA